MSLYDNFVRPCAHCGGPPGKIVLDIREGTRVCTLCATVAEVHIAPTGRRNRSTLHPVIDAKATSNTYVGLNNNFTSSRSQRRLTKLHTRLNGDRRGLQVLYEACENYGQRLRLPPALINRAKAICCEFQKKNSKYKKTRLIAGACTCLACRAAGVCRSLKEISRTALVTKKELGQYLQIVAKVLRVQTHGATPTDLLGRYGSTINASFRTVALAKLFAGAIASKNLLGGRSPHSIAAVVLFLACATRTERNLSLKDVSEAVGIAPNTSGHCLAMLRDFSIPSLRGHERRKFLTALGKLC